MLLPIVPQEITHAGLADSPGVILQGSVVL